MPSERAKRYKAARCYAGLTQKQLAKLLGVDAATVKRREGTGGSDPSIPDLLAVAHFCKVPQRFMVYGWAAIPKPALDPGEVVELELREDGKPSQPKPGSTAADGTAHPQGGPGS